jgi:hypothetical protein
MFRREDEDGQILWYASHPSATSVYKRYETQRQVLIEYLQVMVAREDWHGVADAAMDIRELEAEQRRKHD